MNTPTSPQRPIHEIGREILRVWIKECGAKYQEKYFYALQQREAMESLTSINDNFHADSGRGVVASFLVNVTTWRGEDARRIKAELNKLLKSR